VQKKNIFIVYAHPEPRSLNGALKDCAVSHLRNAGHQVEVSDLYAMGWRAEADVRDFPHKDPGDRLFYHSASKEAFLAGTQAPEIKAEQEKLIWMDALIIQCPMWWFSLPAILKGWVDRVYARRFAYGVGYHGYERYGEGILKGKRALLSMTIGPEEEHYSTRGVHGNMDDLLFPITHGILYYPGMDVLPSHLIYRAAAMPADGFEPVEKAFQERLDGLFTDKPIAFRPQNGGDYDEQFRLKSGVAEGKNGFSIHRMD
jgi:NAD(P)H dehydrogenase (quinone)